MKDYWCIPAKRDADFVACMEDVIDIYERPYDANVPVVCMDEKPYQLIDDARDSLPMRPAADGKEASNAKIDSEYKRNGTCNIFAVVEPKTGWQHVSARERRTALDWAEEIKYLWMRCILMPLKLFWLWTT